MALLPMPKPSKNAWNPDRPMNGLLKWQVEHMHAAEVRLPRHHHTELYVNAIHTEGEAAEYIQAVTEAIHRAHKEAALAKVKPGLGLVAAADDSAAPKAGKSRAKKSAKKKSTS